MDRIRYKILTIKAKGIIKKTIDHKALEDELSRHGNLGWELCTATPFMSNGSFSEIQYILKNTQL